MRAVWQASAASDPFQVLRTMDDFGMSVAQAAQAAGVSEFELSCVLVRLGVPKGYAGLSFSREEVNADFEAQLAFLQAFARQRSAIVLGEVDRLRGAAPAD